MLDWSKVLFVGWGDTSGVTHYRTILPAKQLGAEYVVFDMLGKGVARSGTRKTHDLIVVQHCWQDWQTAIVRKMRESGAFVVVNCDDWIKGIGRLGDAHCSSKYFGSKKPLQEWRNAIETADGVVCATPWLVEKVSQINSNTQLGRNGLDLERYERWIPSVRPQDGRVRLGWAGGTGHMDAFRRIVPAIVENMELHPNLDLHVVGDEMHDLMPSSLRDRTTYHEWSDLDFYPRYLALFDVNLAPGQDNDFYKAKSQLRFYEACAMGTPTIAHPMYSEIEEYKTGFLAATTDEWSLAIDALTADDRLRRSMASSARNYAQSISIEARIPEWTRALTTLMSS